MYAGSHGRLMKGREKLIAQQSIKTLENTHAAHPPHVHSPSPPTGHLVARAAHVVRGTYHVGQWTAVISTQT